VERCPLIPRLRLGGLLALYLALALWHSVVNPLFESPDERFHIGVVVHLVRAGSLPVQVPGRETLWQQEGSQPPLYYMLLAALTRGLGLPLNDFEILYHPNPHAAPGDASRVANRNLALHGPMESFPWRGAALTLHFWRAVSVLLSALTVFATVQAIALLFPGHPSLSLGAGLLVALNPMFLFISGSINNDNLVNATAALTLWLLALRLRRGFAVRRVVGLGLALGAAALAKLSGLVLWPLTAVFLLGIATRERRWARGLREIAVVFGIALSLCAWWFIRNLILYRDPTGLSVMLDIAGRRSATWADLAGEFEGFRRSFWGVFGAMNVLMPVWAYEALDLGTALAILGLVLRVGRVAWEARRARRWGEPWAIGLWLLAYGILLFGAFLRWTSQTMASQGRLMFPAIGPIALALWAGWEEVAGRIGRGCRWWTPLPAAFLGSLALWAPLLWIAPAYRPPDFPIPRVPPQRLEATFGGTFRVWGYELGPAELRPGGTLELTLYLETLQAPTRDWSLFVHLVDDLDIILTQEDRYPRQGLVRATALRPGERWAELVRLRVPDAVVAPACLSLVMGFYDRHTWERLPAQGPDGVSLGDHVRFGDLILQPRPGGYPNPVSYRFGGRIELVGFELAPRRVRPGEAVRLILYWRALRPVEQNYTVFTHILEPPQTLWGQEDRPPDPPTSRWQVGIVYSESYTLRVKPETPPGFYEIEVGLYRPETGERLRLPDSRDFVLLSRIRVEP